MLIDWFTTAAQVVNFLVLVWLLKRFLYGPIIRAMDEREERIGSRMKDAEQREEEAERRKEELEQKREEVEKERDGVLGEAKEEAKRRRRELLEEAREEARELRAEWMRDLRREKDTFLTDLRRLVARETCDVAERALSEMAGADLERQMFEIWRDRVDRLDDDGIAELRQAVGRSDGGLVVRSAFEPDADRRRRLTRFLHDKVGDDVDVDYRSDDALVCGIELRAGSYKLAWSLAGYLDSVRESVGEWIEESARGEGDASDADGEQEAAGGDDGPRGGSS